MAILQPIKPQYCKLIASGRKTREVRKTKPKLKTPFKVYIYCTIPREKENGILLDPFHPNQPCIEEYLSECRNRIGKEGTIFQDTIDLCGKVIGEYVCDKIEELRYDALEQSYIIRNAYSHSLDEEFMKGTCLSYKDAYEYCKNLKCDSKHTDMFYGWHISNLKIYDKPKELSEFQVIDKEYLKNCPYRIRVYNNPEYTNGALLKGPYICNNSFEPDFCRGQCGNTTKILTRPPQSFCYVEEV